KSQAITEVKSGALTPLGNMCSEVRKLKGQRHRDLVASLETDESYVGTELAKGGLLAVGVKAEARGNTSGLEPALVKKRARVGHDHRSGSSEFK
ncbi:MAG TPA: hypothetical protein VHM64_17210, partial [Candidatus Binatia bacterium]|nr:hypothetical protein [Candidatus Binatia bacterium]